MTLVYDHAVEEFRQIFFVVDDFLRRLAIDGSVFGKGCLFRRFIQFLTAQDGVHPLNGADADLYVCGHIGESQPPHAVNLEEGAGIVVGFISEKFPLRLLAERFGYPQGKEFGSSCRISADGKRR